MLKFKFYLFLNMSVIPEIAEVIEPIDDFAPSAEPP